ncbi:MAG: NAD(P)/FAD-dependent oxidoreductase [Chloroflexi bacterium]|nr:NAD(P)/FAD-dependent oxidoreductase [Chloroflexota bacterium]
MGMPEYDVFIAGGAIAGPVAAKFCAKQGLKTLLVEKAKVPRDKTCSGIQFPYFEKIIGDPIPPDRLCRNTLSKVEIHFPNGKVTQVGFPMLSFMRSTFDEWLCRLAQAYGAEFRDGCSFKSCEESASGALIHLEAGGKHETIRARYVVDATGMRAVIRRQLRGAEGFQRGGTGATLNYYFTADGDLQPDTLYQFWNLEFNDAMFAWVYNKTLPDGQDYWVVGTGYEKDIYLHLDRFFAHVQNLYHLKNVNIVKKEGYSASMSLLDERRIWLGERNFLMTGDAAGLIDVTRGVGMDAAALSGRLAAKAIGLAARESRPVGETYARLMKDLVAQTRKNQHSGVQSCATNAALQTYLDKGMLRMGLRMFFQNRLNRLRSGEHQVMLP